MNCVEAPRCEERVWDNGDMDACGNALPCPLHPAEEVAAKKAIDAIHSLVETRYAHGETYTSRLKAIAVLIANAEHT